MSFAHPIVALVVAPVVTALLVLACVLDIARRRRTARSLGDEALMAQMTASLSTGRLVLKSALLVFAVACLLLALGRPQMPGRARLAKSRGLDIVVALDFSKSMLATDVYPSRVERAKRELEKLLDDLQGDRVGLVAFAGEAAAYPLTTDYAAAKLFWKDLSPAQMPVGGTAIGRAINQGVAMLKRVRDISNAHAQVIVLLTDGEDHESDPIAAAKEAAKLGIRVYAVGIGSRSGELVPDPEAAPGAPRYLKDNQGNYVTSKLDEKTLEEIARLTGGEYFRVDPKQFGVERVIEALRKLRRGESTTRLVVEPRELAHVFVFPAFLALIAETLVGDRQRRRPHARVSAEARKP